MTSAMATSVSPRASRSPRPYIDSLAVAGARFTNAYVSSSVCAPSRAGLMTGKHQASFGFRDNLAPVQPGHDPEFVGLPLNQTTLAQGLKALGYTTGLIGKWHLDELPKFSPLQRGVDEFWGYLGGAHDYYRAEPGGEKQMAGPIFCNYSRPAGLPHRRPGRRVRRFHPPPQRAPVLPLHILRRPALADAGHRRGLEVLRSH